MKLTLTPHGELCKLENEIGAEEIVRRASGWIKLSEREPTEADADNEGYVVWIGKEFESFVSLYTHTFLQPADVHWLPLPKFQEQDKDEEAFKEWDRNTFGCSQFIADTAHRKSIWDAALEYARNKQ